jgi:CHC2 zinc finger/DNA polymerase family A/Toprim domain
MPSIFWDVETRSAANLRDVGAWNYAAHATTEPLCLFFAVDDDEPTRWLPGEPVPAPLLAASHDPQAWKLIAHHHEFERAVLEWVLIPRFGFPIVPLEIQHCTQQLALANAYPAELDLLAQALGLPYRKDPAAAKALRDISRPRKPRRGEPRDVLLWDDDPIKHELVRARCRLDVITCRAIWQHPKLKHPEASERTSQILDAVINRRGVHIDRTFTEAARTLAIRERYAINIKLAQLTTGNITSVDQIQRFLTEINARGHRMTSMTKRSVSAVLAGKPDGYVRELLELRRAGARASARKFKRILLYASDQDDRLRGTLRWHGSGPGRWTGLGPQLQNLKRNDSGIPLVAIEAICAGDPDALAAYGNPLTLVSELARATIAAAPGKTLLAIDFASIESRVLAWLAGEDWKLEAYQTYDRTGDKALEPYRVLAARMLGKDVDAVTAADRQLGKAGELAAGFGGAVGAWRRLLPDDRRSDGEIKVDVERWRRAHPRTTRFWHDLGRCIRLAIRTGDSIYVGIPPGPTITAGFADGNLTLTLPSGRRITYPDARLVPAKFPDSPPDVSFKDNARGQWTDYRGWFGTFVENVVQGIARDLLANAIERIEAHDLPVVLHVHDDLVVEVPTGSISEAEFARLALVPPAWANGLPFAGKVRSGAHYLAAPEEPVPAPADADADALGVALDQYIDAARAAAAEAPPEGAEDPADFLDDLAPETAPLRDFVSLPMTSDHKVSCPFHDDPQPSLQIYPDHFHCYGCGEHGDRIDWLVRVEGLSREEALTAIQDWQGANRHERNGTVPDPSEKTEYALTLWNEAGPLIGSLGERYLAETRCIDVAKLPADVHGVLRFHPQCPFGSGTAHPCLVALMRDPVSDAPVGIHRIALKVVDGQVDKIDRWALGRMGVVKLWPAVDGRLVLGEGIETVLAAATRVPFEEAPLTPAWLAVAAGKLKRFPVLADVQRLILLVDNDPEGLIAATAIERTWCSAGRTVTQLIPDQPGADFNDVVRELDAP